MSPLKQLRSSLLLLLALWAGSFACAVAAADEPANVNPDQIRHDIDLLDSDDPHERQDALQALMRLPQQQFETLRQVARDAAPLSPAQADALRTAVEQLFLSPDPARAAPVPMNNINGQMAIAQRIAPRGFIGLHWTLADDGINDLGIIIGGRIPGFGGFRELRDGDVIISLVDHPEVDLHLRQNFISVVAAMQPGQTLRLQVLRHGSIEQISFPLDALPQQNVAQIDDWIDRRNQQAERCWQTEFSNFIFTSPGTTTDQ